MSQGIGFSHLFVGAWRGGMCCISDSNPLTVILGSVYCVFHAGSKSNILNIHMCICRLFLLPNIQTDE